MKCSTKAQPAREPEGQARDAEIAAAILESIQWLTTISPDTIQIGVEQGWVNLEGILDWGHQRDTLAEIIRRVPGVKGIKNLIRLKSDLAEQQAA